MKVNIKIKNPPNTEFNISFPMAFKGIEKTFPIIQKANIQPKIIKTLKKSKLYHQTFINHYDITWTNMTIYPT